MKDRIPWSWDKQTISQNGMGVVFSGKSETSFLGLRAAGSTPSRKVLLRTAWPRTALRGHACTRPRATATDGPPHIS